MATLSLFDLGVKPRSITFDSVGAAVASLCDGSYRNYTSAIVKDEANQVTHFGGRDLGDTFWTVKERKVK